MRVTSYELQSYQARRFDEYYSYNTTNAEVLVCRESEKINYFVVYYNQHGGV